MKKIFTLMMTILISTNLFAANLEFALVGDAGGQVIARDKELYQAIRNQNLTHLVLLGDQLYAPNRSYDAVWNYWTDVSFDVVAIGNHNLNYANEMDYFNMPAEYYSKSFGGSTKFIVLNSDNTQNVTEQLDWLEQELQNSSESNMFLVFHHPQATLSRYHKWQEKQDFQNRLRLIMQTYKNKITAVFNGHEHFAAVYTMNDIPMIVSGASSTAHAVPNLNSNIDGVQYKSQWLYDKTLHFAKLSIDENLNRVEIDFIRVKDEKITCNFQLTPVFLKRCP